MVIHRDPSLSVWTDYKKNVIPLLHLGKVVEMYNNQEEFIGWFIEISD